MNVDSLKNPNPIDKDNNQKLKLNINKNGKEGGECNINDLNIIKVLNKNQLKRRTLDSQTKENDILAFDKILMQ